MVEVRYNDSRSMVYQMEQVGSCLLVSTAEGERGEYGVVVEPKSGMACCTFLVFNVLGFLGKIM